MNSFLLPVNEGNALLTTVATTEAFSVFGHPVKDTNPKNKPGLFRKQSKHVIIQVLAGFLLLAFMQTANAQCYNTTNGYGAGYTTITPSCSNQSVNPPSTSYTQFYPTAGVTYNVSMTGAGWTTLAMTLYNWSGSAWVAWKNNTGTGTLQFTPTSAQIGNGDGRILISVYNGTSCAPNLPWVGNSAVLSYSIATPYTPAIAQNPASGGQVCIPGGVTYTETGSGVGAFNQFVYGWGAAGTNALGSSNPLTWTSCCNGNGYLYVEAQTNNGGCYAYSSPVTVLPDAASAVGSWAYPTLYYCQTTGGTFTSSGTQVYQGITGNVGSTIGWQYGYNCGGWSAVNQNNSTSCPWNCCFPSNPNSILVTVQNGVCAAVTSCYTYTSNGMVGPTTAAVSPTSVCNGYSGNITLTATGGNGGTIAGGSFNWYSGSAGGTYVGAGQNLTIAAPSSTTTYYGAWVDDCGSLSASASATFTVVQPTTVSANSYAICMGGSTTLNPSTGGTWASNNTGYETVSGNTVTPVAPGSTTFTFTQSAAPNCTSTTSAVSVTALPVVNITGPTTFCGGAEATTTLSPTSGGTWVSNNTGVATVSGYTVTGTTAGGSTNFTFTSSTAPNCQNTTGNVNITGLATVYGVTGGGTYCYGSSAPVGLSGSQTGVTYQLVLNGTTNVGSPVTGTGSAISFPNQTVVGTYTVVATTVTNSCPNNMSGSAVVTELTPAVTNSPGATGITPTGGTLNGTD